MDDEPTLLQRVKAQAEVLIPLIRRLETEMGREKTHSILRDVLSDHYRAMARSFVVQSDGDRMAAFSRFAEVSTAGGAVEMELRESPPGRMDVDIVRCDYAKFFQALGEPELGFLFICSSDFQVADTLGIGLERSQTIMQGADHCDFRWIVSEATEPAD